MIQLNYSVCENESDLLRQKYADGYLACLDKTQGAYDKW